MKPTSETPSVQFIDLLPALTLLIVFALFSVQALTTTAAPPGHHQQTNLRQTLPAGQPQNGAELPVLGRLSDFKLTERDGSDFDLPRMQGKVWVADFIFTSCQAECPLMNLEMQKIQQAFADEQSLGLVSFSVDPATDTPARLQTYAEQFKAGPNWWFVTGAKDELYRVATQDFMLAVQDLRPSPGQHDHHDMHSDHGAATSQPFIHSQTFALVDGKGQIRGFYDSTRTAVIQDLIEKDLPRLLAQG